MKLTKSKLKEIIEEELKEGLHPLDHEIQLELYNILVRNGLAEAAARKLLSNVGMDTLIHLLRIFKTEDENETNEI